VILVSDASPLISLVVTGHLELLKHLYKRVIIPEEAYQELTGSDPWLPGASEVQTLEWIVSPAVQNDVVVRALIMLLEKVNSGSASMPTRCT
jgi:predicted nucleic acid-binding protein